MLRVRTLLVRLSKKTPNKEETEWEDYFDRASRPVINPLMFKSPKSAQPVSQGIKSGQPNSKSTVKKPPKFHRPVEVQRRIITSSDLISHHLNDDVQDSSSELQSEFFEEDAHTSSISPVQLMKKKIRAMDERIVNTMRRRGKG